MAISFAQEGPWGCPNCGASAKTLNWLAIDLEERPDLRAFVALGDWVRVRCPRCGVVVQRDHPLLVTRLSAVAPVVMGVPDALVGAGEPPDVSRPVIERVRAELGDALRDIPGPLLLVPLDVLAIAAGRDVDADFITFQRAPHTADLLIQGERYAAFLNRIRETDSARRVGLALNRLRAITSLDELKSLAAEFPEVTSPQALEELAHRVEQASVEQERQFTSSQLNLAKAIAGGQLKRGWLAYRIATLRFVRTHFAPRLAHLKRELDRRVRAGNHSAAIRVRNEILHIAKLAGMNELEAVESMAMAMAFLEIPGEGRAQRIEDAIALMERVLEILDVNPKLNRPALRAETLANLGAAYGTRLRHDPAANLDRAIACLRQSLEQISMRKHGDLWAMAHTNLGLSLLERHKLQRSQDPGNEDRVGEAIEHFETALQRRSFERNPLDWAFTQINLGLAFDRRQDGDRRMNLLQAIEHAESAHRGFAAAGATAPQAQALHNISSSKFDLARLDDTGESERTALLVEAEAAARSSLQTRGLAEAPVEAGGTYVQLAHVLDALGDRAGAVDAYSLALKGLTPLTAPQPCRDAARALASLAAGGGDWRLAADAWESAVEAAAAAFEARATSEGRFGEVRENLNIFRWAAYALTHVGKLERAVEVLELGRARELAAWLQRDLVDLDQLGHLDPVLRDRFVELRSHLEQFDRTYRAGFPVSAVEAGHKAESFRATVDEIRNLPGLERFLDRPNFAEVAAAARSGDPIVYVVTSPDGSVAILVWAAGDADARVELVDVPVLTSTEIVQVLLKVDPDATTVGGYVVAQAGESDDLDSFLPQLSSLIGERLLKPLAKALADGGASAVCLVPFSLMGLLPLHALQWEEPSGRRCLLDDFDVVFAPSAAVRSVCLDRTARSVEPWRLLAVGNPLPHPFPLPGAEFEVEMVARTFPTTSAEVLIGRAATREAVVAGLRAATHVHLACHGSADPRDEMLTAALSFANGERLSARELVDIDGFSARLVVASACQTGVVQGYETADEVLGLATAFIGAGAAGVVATLWLVDDYATGLLMSRFYELLVGVGSTPGGNDGMEPAAALRGAQLWLRTMTVAEEEAYLRDHPVLRAHRQVAGATATARSAMPASADHPYGSPSFWAPFIFTGA